VEEIARAAQFIRDHELSRRLPMLQTGDELQSLSETLNEMFGRLERAFKRVTQFTAEASHELRIRLHQQRVCVLRLRAPDQPRWACPVVSSIWVHRRHLSSSS
jgi:nitrate/nitrite-specific signal transduction histidine kinase